MSTPWIEQPEHLRIGLTKNGDGPVLSEDDPKFDHWGCWCLTPGCKKYLLRRDE